MGRIKKKGTSGNAKNYITRSQAVRKLQITLPEFRRLCVFKGIYPREPRSKKKASRSSTPSTTFYYAKDIQYLLHEPILAKFRDQKALAKKISKALGRNEVSDAVRLERNLTPRLRLDHIVKERYPTFVDALRDLDDALTLLFLFASLPSSENVPASAIAKCRRLTTEFEHYLIRCHALRKSFLSIKGIYYQATIQGQDILWVVPYRFVQRTAGDVDYRIMATFVEFYMTLLGFVNFRLYTSAGLVYPPRFDTEAEARGAELGAFSIGTQVSDVPTNTKPIEASATTRRAQKEADRLLDMAGEVENTTEAGPNHDEHKAIVQTLDTFAPIDLTADSLAQPDQGSHLHGESQIFEPFTFFLGRETPRHSLEFILRAFGCKRIAWDSSIGEPGSFCPEDDLRITHQIVDRPSYVPPLTSKPDAGVEVGTLSPGQAHTESQSGRVPGRTYVQPQWVWDCINSGQLQRPDQYAPGATLPPHLSPWAKSKPGEYDPRLPLAMQESIDDVEARQADDADGVRKQETVAADAYLSSELYSDEGGTEGMQVELADSDDDDDDDDGSANESNDDSHEPENDNEWDGLPDDVTDHRNDYELRKARRHQTELEVERKGSALVDETSSSIDLVKERARSERKRREREAQEDVERRKMMMPRRKRKMYEKMVYSNARRDEAAGKLRDKRRKLEQGQ